MVSTLVLDVDSLTLLRELLDDIWLPAGFASVWDQTADPAQLAAARASAGQRLRTAGLLIPAEPADPTDSPDPTEPADSTEPAGEDVHPSLRAALEAFGRAEIRMEVRSWAGDRAVIADLAVGQDAGIGLARLQRVAPHPTDSGNRADRADGTGSTNGTSSSNGTGSADSGPGPEDAIGVELAIFESSDVLAAIERLLPPLPPPPPSGEAATTNTPTTSSTPVPIEPLRVGWQEGLALLALLRRRGSIASEQLPVAREVLRILLAAADLTAVPPLLDQLTRPLEAAIRITLSASDNAAGEHPVWFGYWLQCGGQLIAVRAEPRSVPTAEPAVEASDPGSPADVVLTLVPSDALGLRADLLLALTGAFVAGGFAEEDR